MSQKTFAEIDLKALAHNLGIVRKKTGSRNMIAVVKANAYGHGSVEIAKHLISLGVPLLGVAFTGEAIRLREAGINVPILVFFDKDNIDECFRYNLTPVIFDLHAAKKFSAAARKLKRTISIHIKVDTGMGRIGLTLDKAYSEILKITALPNLAPEGLMSHFSDADLQDKEFANHQLSAFVSLRKDLSRKKITFKYAHIANSAAVLSMPGAHMNMVRPGIMLYGYGISKADNLRPVLSLKSSILMIKKVPAGTPISYARTFVTKRKSIIATIPAGYADGYDRKLSNSGEVLVKGKRAPIAGRVCMDTIMVDVTDIPGVREGTEVVLIGEQGKENITAADIAAKTGTIPYEVLTSIGHRVKRVFY
ncbi:MAG: alanine racemase [Nitrospiraceae bacterium]|nr:MAG: alanine racemase [Nitrospiraceae bacterium]